ncbi:MAG: hypothetical protein R6U20_00470 [Longimonas sp.]|uniref:hypothetical protein n=1 Tax=Longimonas sp. TaxID=2039626 RepID=UPI0039760985
MGAISVSQIKDEARSTYGIVPSFFTETGAYTGTPAAAYMIADEALLSGVLTCQEQQAVLLELARYLNSRYDAVVHARMALDAGLSPQIVGQLLDGENISDRRLNALVKATRLSCKKRAWLSPDELSNLQQHNVTRGDLYEIFALIGVKKMTAFTHHMSDFPVEAPLQPINKLMNNRFEKPKNIKRQRLFTG